ncbi:MAG: hypothetical protein HYY48_07010 [Gammaproteobacteria bacterium]|nr:hypothetical protein [Gammaproteobacteria bacterium]
MAQDSSTLRQVYFVVGVILVLVLLNERFGDTSKISDFWNQAFQEREPETSPGTSPPAPAAALRTVKSVEPALPAQPPETVAEPPAVSPAAPRMEEPFGIPVDVYRIQRFGPVPKNVDPAGQQQFRDHFAAKLRNPDYIARNNRKGIPTDFQDYPEEALIKQDRARVAAKMEAPKNTTPVDIPILSGKSPVIDGFVDPNEWGEAIVLPAGGADIRTRIYLVADGKRLYLACTAPDDTTETGFDQFRFYFHLNITPELVNERIHVGGRGGAMALRQTGVRWTGPPAANEDERWKSYPISDWVIYKHHEGGSAIHEYRHYEASLDLEEIGLHAGVPFPARFEVETDPTLDQDGNFKQRNELGNLGSDDKPIWFLLARRQKTASIP